MKEQYQKLLQQATKEDFFKVLNEHPTLADQFLIEVLTDNWYCSNRFEGYSKMELHKYCGWCDEWLRNVGKNPNQKEHYTKIQGDSIKIFQTLKDNGYISNSTTEEQWKYMCSGELPEKAEQNYKDKIVWEKEQYLLGVFIDRCFHNEDGKWKIMQARFRLRKSKNSKNSKEITDAICSNIQSQLCKTCGGINKKSQDLMKML